MLIISGLWPKRWKRSWLALPSLSPGGMIHRESVNEVNTGRQQWLDERQQNPGTFWLMLSFKSSNYQNQPKAWTSELPETVNSYPSPKPNWVEFTWNSWWLILYVDLTGVRDSQIAGKNKQQPKKNTPLFLGVSLRMFPEHMSIWIRTLSKKIILINADGHHPIHWRPE